MKKRIGSGYGLTLFELIIAIGFFAVFASVCMRIFLSARQSSDQNTELNHAIIVAENAAECFKAGIDPVLYFDDNWNPIGENDATYRLDVTISYEDRKKTADITVIDKEGEEVFSLKAKALEETIS